MPVQHKVSEFKHILVYEQIKSGTLKVNNSSPSEHRFWSRVSKPLDMDISKCWLWTGFIFPDGYGTIRVHYKKLRAHVYSWVLHFGPIQNNLLVLHKCDVPKCVNPSHLFLGTHLDNMMDKVQKGRQSKGLFNGRSKLSVANVQFIRREYRYRSKTNGITGLAKRFGVTPHAIFCVVKYTTWKNV